MKKFHDLKENAEEVKTSSRVKGQRSTLSINIVNSVHNGKRITLSKGLLEALSEPESIQFMTSKDDGVLIIGKNLGVKNSFKFSETNPCVIYCSGLVNSITEEFELSYTNKTSMSFSDIEIDDNDGEPVAIIKMKD